LRDRCWLIYGGSRFKVLSAGTNGSAGLWAFG
jgi:hypothetical protein